MSYKEGFAKIIAGNMAPENSENSNGRAVVVSMAVSFMNLLKVVRTAEAVKELDDTFRSAVQIAMADVLVLWPNSPILQVQNGRALHQMQMAMADWMDSPTYALAAKQAEDAKDAQAEVENKMRAGALRETALSAVIDMIRLSGFMMVGDPQASVRLRKALAAELVA